VRRPVGIEKRSKYRKSGMRIRFSTTGTKKAG
jgi:hypothetical protein